MPDYIDRREDDVLGEMRANTALATWESDIPFEDGWLRVTLCEKDGAAMCYMPPRVAGFFRLREAVGALGARLIPAAISAAGAAGAAHGLWQAPPDVDAWSALELYLDREDRLWLLLFETESDPMARTLVEFDARDRPVSIRRDGPDPTEAPFASRGALLWLAGGAEGR